MGKFGQPSNTGASNILHFIGTGGSRGQGTVILSWVSCLQVRIGMSWHMILVGAGVATIDCLYKEPVWLVWAHVLVDWCL